MSRKTVPVQKICPVCDQPFDVCPPHRRSRYYPAHTQIFCSVECAGAGRYRSGRHCQKLTPIQAAYIAGFLDADGSVFLYRRRQKVALRVAFANNDRSVLDWIRHVTGLGSVVRYDDGHAAHAVRFQLQANAEAALTLLEQIAPYLIRKRTQAALGISHQVGLHDPAHASSPEWHQTNYDQMTILNARGS